jgi:S1-C subfamily serine protease
MRLLIIIAALLVSCGPRAGVKTPLIPSEVQRHATVAIYVTCVDIGGNLFSKGGSGVITGKHTILTANHVVECSGMSAIFVETLGGALFEMQVVVQMDEYDLAKLVSEETLPWQVLRIGPQPQPGDVVCHESAIPTRARKCGTVRHVSEEPSNRDIRHTAQSESGNSGSGMFDSRGRLIGIVTMKRMDKPGGSAASLWNHREVLGSSY